MSQGLLEMIIAVRMQFFGFEADHLPAVMLSSERSREGARLGRLQPLVAVAEEVLLHRSFYCYYR